MGEKEKSVFETLNENIVAMVGQMQVANEALVVVATELYLTRRELTDIFKKMNSILGTLAKTEFVPETKEVSAVQDTSKFEEMVFPKSATSTQTEEKAE